MLTPLQKLWELYNRLPGMECIPGCTDCCGRAPWSQLEFDRLTDEEKSHYADLTYACPYCVVDKGCSVHDRRPFVCRYFGVVSGADCPHGRKSDNNLDLMEGVKITLQYRNNFF
jgi:hypothetical protein